jgi:hypothetical protein
VLPTTTVDEKKKEQVSNKYPQPKGAGVYDASNVAEFSVVTRTAKTLATNPAYTSSACFLSQVSLQVQAGL